MDWLPHVYAAASFVAASLMGFAGAMTLANYLRSRDRVLGFLCLVFLFLGLVSLESAVEEYVRQTDLSSNLTIRLAIGVSAAVLELLLGLLLVVVSFRFVGRLPRISRWWKRLHLVLPVLLLALLLAWVVYLVTRWEVLGRFFALGPLFLTLHAYEPLLLAPFWLNQEPGKLKNHLRNLVAVTALGFPCALFDLLTGHKTSYLVMIALAPPLFAYLQDFWIGRYELASGTDAIRVFADRHDLSPREREILPLLVDGLSNQDAAARLFISVNTLKVHVRNIYAKTGAANRIQLSAAIKSGR